MALQNLVFLVPEDIYFHLSLFTVTWFMINPGQKFEEAIKNTAVGWGRTSTASTNWVGPRKSPRKSLRFLDLSPYVTRNHRNRNFLVLRHVGPCGHSVKYPSGSTVCVAVAENLGSEEDSA